VLLGRLPQQHQARGAVEVLIPKPDDEVQGGERRQDHQTCAGKHGRSEDLKPAAPALAELQLLPRTGRTQRSARGAIDASPSAVQRGRAMSRAMPIRPTANQAAPMSLLDAAVR
jgi:hypothetical protein